MRSDGNKRKTGPLFLVVLIRPEPPIATNNSATDGLSERLP